MTTGLKLYNHALGDFGLTELPGARSHPRIQQAINLAASWLDKDDSKTAWCGCIMGLWFKELGLTPPKEHYRANEWKQVGKMVLLSEAQQGDVVVMDREGGKHVALFSKMKGDLIYLLGGNQNNQVNVSAFNKGFVEAVRRV